MFELIRIDTPLETRSPGPHFAPAYIHFLASFEHHAATGTVTPFFLTSSDLLTFFSDSGILQLN